jgi:hypothetical protein
MVIGVVHHGFGDERGRADALERGDAPGAFLRAVHAAGVELDDAVGIR